MSWGIKIIQVFLLAAIKFFYTPLYAYAIGLSLWEVLLTMMAGGLSSYFVFLRFFRPVSQWIDKRCKNTFRKKQNYTPKKFTRKNKMLIRFKNTYGRWGMLLLTPPLISIPLGAFVASKYYKHDKYFNLQMVISILLWAAILSFAYNSLPFWV